MRIITTGTLTIASNHETLNFKLEDFESGFDPYDTLETLDFDYAEIFEMVCDTLNKEGYDVLDTKESFNGSILWKDLGFAVGNDFEIVRIEKDISVDNYMNYGQNAAFIIDLEEETVEYDDYYKYRNDLDNLIFDWGYVYNEEGSQTNGSDILDDIAALYSKYINGTLNAKEVEENTIEYALSLYDEEGSSMTEGFVDELVNVLKPYIKANTEKQDQLFNKYKGNCISVTGTFNHTSFGNYSVKEMADLIRKLGALFVESIEESDILIVGGKAGKKLEKAISLSKKPFLLKNFSMI